MACHLADGTRGLPANPILQGQHPEYLVKQLTEFKAGKRKNAIMTGMAAPLARRRHEAHRRLLRQQEGGGRRRPRQGPRSPWASRSTAAASPAKQVPACAGCHSPNGAGIPAQYPRLGGQHAEYLPRRRCWPSGPANVPTACR
jgi:cytochrome c553